LGDLKSSRFNRFKWYYGFIKRLAQLYVAVAVWSYAIIKFNVSNLGLIILSLGLVLFISNIDEVISYIKELRSRLGLDIFTLSLVLVGFPIVTMPFFVHSYLSGSLKGIPFLKTVISFNIAAVRSDIFSSYMTLIIEIAGIVIQFIPYRVFTVYINRKAGRIVYYVTFALFTVPYNLAIIFAEISLSFPNYATVLALPACILVFLFIRYLIVIFVLTGAALILKSLILAFRQRSEPL